MKKYISKKKGTEVKVGDTIPLKKKVSTKYGDGTLLVDAKITEETLQELVKDGIIQEIEIEPVDITEDEVFSEIVEFLKKVFYENGEQENKEC